MLLKFSNILALGIAAWHRKVCHVANLARHLVIAWTRCLKLLASRDVRSLARAKPKLGRFVLERLCIVLIVAWAGDLNHRLGQVSLQLDSHGIVSTRLLGEGIVWIVAAAAWDVQC